MNVSTNGKSVHIRVHNHIIKNVEVNKRSHSDFYDFIKTKCLNLYF